MLVYNAVGTNQMTPLYVVTKKLNCQSLSIISYNDFIEIIYFYSYLIKM